MSGPGVRALTMGILVALSGSVLRLDSAEPTEARVRRYKIPDNGTLVLTHPPAWRSKASTLRELGTTSIEIHAPPADDPMILMSVMGGAACREMAQDPDKLQESVERRMRTTASKAAEGSVRIFRFRSESGDGFVFTATDSAPEEDGYRYLWQGTRIVAGRVCLVFTMLTNDQDSPEADVALRIIKDVNLEPK